MATVTHSYDSVTMMKVGGEPFDGFGPGRLAPARLEAYDRGDGIWVVDVPVDCVGDALSHDLVATPPMTYGGVADLSPDAKAEIKEAVEAEGSKSEKDALRPALAADPEGTPHPEVASDELWDGLTGDHPPPKKPAVKK